MKHNKQAFTLIELLVVVLIIGILAAIAVPQYQKAVRKARVSEAKILLKAIGNAGELYCLSIGSCIETPRINDFDISIPTETKTWNLGLEEADQGGVLYFAEPKFETGYVIYYADHKYAGEGNLDWNGRFICDGLTADGKKICASLGNGDNFFENYYHID